MTRIDIRTRLIEVKLVYYGPALGGKTTNLQALHAMMDPTQRLDLLSLDTDGDRTLFFDLLPLDLEDVQGFKVKIRLFTVPGQVHYNATRRIVLRDVDGAVFVADSTPDRLAANGESMKSLHENLLANGVKPGQVPILVQANKRDMPGAATLSAVEASLCLDQFGEGAVLPNILPASAVSGEGVFESFEQILRAGLAAAHDRQGLGRMGLRREAMGYALFEALVPLRARARALDEARAASTQAMGLLPRRETLRKAEEVLPAEQLLAVSVQRAVDLAQSLGDQQAQATTLARRIAELETIREFSRVLVSTVDASQVARALVIAARTAFKSGAASVLVPGTDDSFECLAVEGMPGEPLLAGECSSLVAAIHRANRPACHGDIENDLLLGARDMLSAFSPFCTSAIVPLQMAGVRGMLVAYGSDAAHPASADTLRFMTAIASQASLAFQNADRHFKLVEHGAQLEKEVASRTQELRVAHEEVAAASRMKDRLLSAVNHELRTPVTKLLAAAQVLDRTRPGFAPPPQFTATIVTQARHLAGLLDQVLAARTLLAREAGDDVADEVLSVGRAMESAAFTWQERAAARRVTVHVEPQDDELAVRAGAGAVTLMLSQLVDNALKFTPPGTQVRVRAERPDAERVRIVVEDEGPGVPAGDAERIFAEFDQGSGDVLTAKPNGLGLGLVIARRMARRLGGDVGVTQSSTGSSFWIELPAAVHALPLAIAATG